MARRLGLFTAAAAIVLTPMISAAQATRVFGSAAHRSQDLTSVLHVDAYGGTGETQGGRFTYVQRGVGVVRGSVTCVLGSFTPGGSFAFIGGVAEQSTLSGIERGSGVILVVVDTGVSISLQPDQFSLGPTPTGDLPTCTVTEFMTAVGYLIQQPVTSGDLTVEPG